jgi:hypothetical protein
MADALPFARQLGISVAEISGSCDYAQDFRRPAPSEEIALLRYEHYLKQRNSKEIRP